MPKFTDAKGREWAVTITVADLKPLRDAGCDLAELAKDGERFADAMFLRSHDLGPVFWMLAKKRATGLGFAITEDDFFDALDATAFDAALVAFWEAFADFFRHTPIGLRIRQDGAAAAMKAVEDAILASVAAPNEPAAPTPSAA